MRRGTFYISFIIIVFLLGTNNIFAMNIDQESLTIADRSSTVTVEDNGIFGIETNSRIEFNAVGDYIIYKLVLKNIDKDNYKIKSVNDNNTNHNIEVKYDYNTEMNTENKTIFITLKYHEKITNQSIELNDIKVTILLIDEANNMDDIIIDSLNNNPHTGDNIKIYVFLSFISLICLTLSISKLDSLKTKVKKNNRNIFILLLLITIIPTMVFSKEIQEIVFSINFNNIKINYKHIVIFDSNGGTEINSQIIDHNDVIIKPANPTKENYKFFKWKDEDNVEFDFNKRIQGDKKLFAIWRTEKYTFNKYITNGNYSRMFIGEEPTENTILYNSEDEVKAVTNRPFYLKHELEENIVKESYACFDKGQTYCLMPVVAYEDSIGTKCKDEFLDTVTNKCISPYYESNKEILKSVFGEHNCIDYSTSFYCSIVGFHANAWENGSVSVSDDHFSCGVSRTGVSYCLEY